MSEAENLRSYVDQCFDAAEDRSDPASKIVEALRGLATAVVYVGDVLAEANGGTVLKLDVDVADEEIDRVVRRGMAERRVGGAQ